MPRVRSRQPLAAALLVAAFAIAPPVHAQAQKVKAEAALAETAEISGKVVSIDRADRAVAILGQNGNVLVVEVDKAVRNFNQIRVGDTVKLQYFEAVAIYVAKDGEPPQADVDVAAVRAPKGAKPSGGVVEVTDVSAQIEEIDFMKRTMVLKGPQGNLFGMRVDPSVKAFDSFKKGDSVHVRHTEAIALTVSRI
jgi:hypothetical protein